MPIRFTQLLKKISLLLVTSFVFGGVFSTVSAQNIVERAKEAGTFETLLTAAAASGLAGVLEGPGPYTVFAPTDEAFSKLPAGTIDNLLKPENKRSLEFIISYHVVAGRLSSFEIPSSRIEVSTLNGAKVSLISSNGVATADAANITELDIRADNGVIHVIDKVLLPGIYRAPSIPTFSQAPEPASEPTPEPAPEPQETTPVLAQETQPSEVMVAEPTIEQEPAIEPIPDDKNPIVDKAISSSNSTTTTTAQVLETYDLRREIIEERNKNRPRTTRRPLAGKNLIQVANEAGQFRTLLLALQIARMDAGVAKYQNYTVFAPTDLAFERLPRATRQYLLNPRNRRDLVNVLANHIVEGNLSSDRIRNGSSRLRTLNPRFRLRVEKRNGRVYVENANVIDADIRANNGIIHVIDQVIISSPRLRRIR